MAAVTFTAPCPTCGHDATWQQYSGNGYAVTPGDFTIRCRGCDAPADEAA